MADDEMINQLRRWGYATVNRFAANDDGPSAGDSVLAKTRDLAPGTRENFERQLIGRDGEARLRWMAAKADVKGLAKLPAWSCDPIRSRNDADAPHERHAVVDLGVPDDLRWIDRALASLERQFPVRAMVVREEFCGVGTHRMKAGRVARLYGGQLSVRQYRYELQRGLDWMRGRVAA